MWRDDRSPYGIVLLTDEQLDLSDRVRHALPAQCFQNANGAHVPDHRDAHIVAESMAIGAKMLLTSNLRTINHDEINRWAIANGNRFGFKPEPVVHEADGILVERAQTPKGRERLLQAGLIACWPANDETPADEIIKGAIDRIEGASRGGGRLPQTGDMLIHELHNQQQARKLIEKIRRGLPHATITTDREHPTFPKDPATAPSPTTGSSSGNGKQDAG